MTTLKLKLGFITLAFFISVAATAQNEGVSIKPSPSAPNASAMLDIESGSKGLLIPRVSLTSYTAAGPITGTTLPEGLLVFNTGSVLPHAFYFWDASVTTPTHAPIWKQLNSSPELWTKFSTSNDIQYYGGNVRVGNAVSTSTPQYDFEVRSDSLNDYTAFFETKHGHTLRFGNNDNPSGWNGFYTPGTISALSQTSGSMVCSPCITGTNSFTGNYYHSMRYSQLYNNGDIGLLITSYNRQGNNPGVSVIETGTNNVLSLLSPTQAITLASPSISIGNGTLSTCFTSGSWGTCSDSTLKKNIFNEKTVLDKISKCRPVTYAWKSDKEGKLNHGFIAQEIEHLFPEVIVEMPAQKNPITGNEEPKKGVNYTEFISILLKAVQEQQQQIETLKTKVAKLEKGK